MLKFQSQLPTLNRDDKYPLLGIIGALALIYAAPFITMLLVYPALLICIYRVVRYDEKVFATDYCILIAVSLLFCTSGGMSLLVYLCLFADVWYFIRRGIRAEAAVVGLLLLLNYMIWRMQFNISSVALCFGQLFLLYVLIPQQDSRSAERAAKAFCGSLLLSSAYALVFRETGSIVALRGPEVPAYWGSSLMRFYGLFQDPNYYAMLLIMALTLMIKLKDSKKIGWPMFIIGSLLLTACGILTYSKTFFLMLVLLVAVFLVWQFWNKKVIRGILLTICLLTVGGILLFSEGSPFSVVLTRLTSSTNLDELTTGRSELFASYFRAITEDLGSALIGKGLAAGNLGQDPHNLFLEITYYMGLVGLVLMVGYYSFLVRAVAIKVKAMRTQTFIATYVTLMIAAILHVTLHGMTALVSYATFLVASMAMLIGCDSEEDLPCQSC